MPYLPLKRENKRNARFFANAQNDIAIKNNFIHKY